MKSAGISSEVQTPVEPGEAIRRLAAAISLHAMRSASARAGAGERKDCLPGTGEIRADFHQIDGDMTAALNQDPQSTDLLR